MTILRWCRLLHVLGRNNSYIVLVVLTVAGGTFLAVRGPNAAQLQTRFAYLGSVIALLAALGAEGRGSRAALPVPIGPRARHLLTLGASSTLIVVVVVLSRSAPQPRGRSGAELVAEILVLWLVAWSVATTAGYFLDPPRLQAVVVVVYCFCLAIETRLPEGARLLLVRGEFRREPEIWWVTAGIGAMGAAVVLFGGEKDRGHPARIGVLRVRPMLLVRLCSSSIALLLIASLLAMRSTSGAVEVSGRTLDAAGNGVQAVIVAARGPHQVGVRSDVAGHFRLRLRPGVYEFSADAGTSARLVSVRVDRRSARPVVIRLPEP